MILVPKTGPDHPRKSPAGLELAVSIWLLRLAFEISRVFRIWLCIYVVDTDLILICFELTDEDQTKSEWQKEQMITRMETVRGLEQLRNHKFQEQQKSLERIRLLRERRILREWRFFILGME